MVLVMKSTTSPTLKDGSFNVYIGEYEKINAALVTFDQSMNVDGSGQLDMSYNLESTDGSDNYVSVHFKHREVGTGAASGKRADAVTGQLTNKKVVVLADCV